LISLHLKNSNSHHWINTKGVLNRLNGFSYRRWHPNGQLWAEEYWVDGRRHNLKRVARKGWHGNGQLKWEEYWLKGIRDNPKGPAYKAWYENGQLKWEEYWLKGKQVDKSTFEKSQKASLG